MENCPLLQDPVSPSSITINANSSTFIFDNVASNAEINVTGMGTSTAITTALQLNSNLVVTNGTTFALNGLISGAGGLTKSGAGTLTLGGTGSTFAGNVAVQQGQITMDFGSRTLPSTASLDISAGATFSYLQTNSNTRTISGLTGAGTFTGNFGGSKTIIINNAVNNTFTGTIGLLGSGTNTNTFTKQSGIRWMWPTRFHHRARLQFIRSEWQRLPDCHRSRRRIQRMAICQRHRPIDERGS